MDYYDYYGFRPYVSVAARRARAARELAKLQKKGRKISPVVIEGRTIAGTFWGEAWCDNLERYSDFATRLPRGRTYVRNGSVVDLQVGPGSVTALVSGSTMYDVKVTVGPVSRARWSAICEDCSGAIDSLVELLQGRFSKGVMTRLCEEKTGLFPSPQEILFTCSCPDWASMCKHVAAVLYGIGARLDHQPELLFTLRKVDQQDLIAKAGSDISTTRKARTGAKVLETDDLSSMFGIEIYAHDVTVERVRVEGNPIDSVLVGGRANGEGYSSDVTIRDSSLTGGTRNVVSVTAVQGLTIEHCLLTGADDTNYLPETGHAYGNPAAGIDVEPNSAGDPIEGVRIAGNQIEANAGPGILLALPTAPVVAPSIDISGNRITGNGLKTTPPVLGGIVAPPGQPGVTIGSNVIGQNNGPDLVR